MLLRSITSVIAISLLSFQAHSGLILETYNSGTATPDTIGGYEMTDFALTNLNHLGETTSTVTAPITGDTLQFRDKDKQALEMSRNTADSIGTDASNDLGLYGSLDSTRNERDWWVNGESSDYDVYTTDHRWVEILLPENTRAFSFNVGANLGSTGQNAWLRASGSFNGSISKSYFNVNYNNTPGFGIYAEPRDDGQCGSITSIIIDPEYWGLGNFSINQGACNVTEPSSWALLGLGLVGLLSLRRRT